MTATNHITTNQSMNKRDSANQFHKNYRVS